jgi:hypothetical protein
MPEPQYQQISVDDALASRDRMEKKANRTSLFYIILLVVLIVLGFVFRGNIANAYRKHVKPIFNKAKAKTQQINKQNVQRDSQRRNKRLDDAEKAAGN